MSLTDWWKQNKAKQTTKKKTTIIYQWSGIKWEEYLIKGPEMFKPIPYLPSLADLVHTYLDHLLYKKTLTSLLVTGIG